MYRYMYIYILFMFTRNVCRQLIHHSGLIIDSCMSSYAASHRTSMVSYYVSIV